MCSAFNPVCGCVVSMTIVVPAAVTTYHCEPMVVPFSKPSQISKVPGQSVGACWHMPLEQIIPAPHEVALPHCPQASHVWMLLPEHCFAFGVHTGDGGQEQEPHEQLVLHVSNP